MQIELEVEAKLNRKLWLRVLQQATAEAEGQQMYLPEEELTKAPLLQRRAQLYLSRCSRSLAHVCSLAGLTVEQYKLLVEINKGKYGKEEN